MDINKLTAMANRLSIPQLQQAIRGGSLPAYVGIPLLQQKVQESKQLQAAQAAGRPQAPTVASQVEGEADQHEMMKRQALAMQAQMAGTGGISDMLRKPEPQAMAKGGAVAFTGGQIIPGLTYQQALDIMNEPMATPEEKAQAQQVIAQQKTDQPIAAPQVQPQAQPQSLSAIYDAAIAQTPVETAEHARKRREEYLGPNAGIASLQEDVSKLKDEAAADKEKAGHMALMKAGLATMAGTSPYALTNIGAGAQAGVADFMDAQKEYRKTLDKQRDLTYKLNAAERQEKMDVFKFGEDSAAASRSANNALRIGQAKEVEDSRVNNARLQLEEQRNRISKSIAEDTADYHKNTLANNVYVQARELAKMQDNADKLRANGDEKGAVAIEREIFNRATSIDLANPKSNAQSQDQKIWSTTANRLGADVNNLRTAMTRAHELFQKSTFSTPEAKKEAENALAKLEKDYEKAYTAYQNHINTQPFSKQETTDPADTQQSQWGIPMGTKKNGYTYIGGNPNEESSWRKD